MYFGMSVSLGETGTCGPGGLPMRVACSQLLRELQYQSALQAVLYDRMQRREAAEELTAGELASASATAMSNCRPLPGLEQGVACTMIHYWTRESEAKG